MNHKLILPSAIILVLSGCSTYKDHTENPYMDNEKAMHEQNQVDMMDDHNMHDQSMMMEEKPMVMHYENDMDNMVMMQDEEVGMHETHYRTVVVEKGDTLTSIVQNELMIGDDSPNMLQRYIHDIVELNELNNPDLIHVGQKIMLP